MEERTGEPEPLHPDEEAELGQVSPGRHRQFALGRTCARAALAQLGFDGPLLRVGRAPAWPDGITGSITHTDGYAAAAVASDLAGIGIDAERHRPLSPGVERRVSSDAERERHPDLTLVIFSAKESIYKAWATATGEALVFADADVVLEPDGRLTATIKGTVALAGRWALDDDLVRTAVVVERHQI